MNKHNSVIGYVNNSVGALSDASGVKKLNSVISVVFVLRHMGMAEKGNIIFFKKCILLKL